MGFAGPDTIKHSEGKSSPVASSLDAVEGMFSLLKRTGSWACFTTSARGACIATVRVSRSATTRGITLLVDDGERAASIMKDARRASA